MKILIRKMLFILVLIMFIISEKIIHFFTYDKLEHLENTYISYFPKINYSLKSYNKNRYKQNIPVNFLIVSHSNIDFSYFILVNENHKKYAKLHGYDYLFYNEILDGNFLDLEDPIGKIDKNTLYWQKLIAIQRSMHIMEHGQHKYKWIFWIDGNAVFTNFEQKLEDLITNIIVREIDNFIITQNTTCTREKNIFTLSACINPRVFFIRNNKVMRKFIKDVIDSFDIYKNYPYPVEMAIGHHMFGLVNNKAENKTLNIKLQNNTKNNFKFKLQAGFKIITPRLINSVYSDSVTDQSSTFWKPGDFIANFTDDDNREIIIPKFLKCIQDNYSYRNLYLCENIGRK